MPAAAVTQVALVVSTNIELKTRVAGQASFPSNLRAQLEGAREILLGSGVGEVKGTLGGAVNPSLKKKALLKKGPTML